MQGSRKRRNTLFAGISLVAVAVAAGIVLTGTAIAGKSGHAASSPPYDFVVSNNFLGNDWRPQVEKLAVVDVQAASLQGEGQHEDRQLCEHESGADRGPQQHHSDKA